MPPVASFEFEYVGLRHLPGVIDGRRDFAVFGRVTSGVVPHGRSIALEGSDGSEVLGTISHFRAAMFEDQEFYDGENFVLGCCGNIQPADGPVCIVVVTDASEPAIRCPGRARPPRGPDPRRR